MELGSQAGCLARLQLIYYYPVEGRSGGASLQAAYLAAAAYLVIVQQREMAYLAGESGLAVIQLAVQDHSHSKTPAEVYEKHVVFVAGFLVVEVFPEGHRPGIVLYVHRDLELILEYGLEREVVPDEVSQAVALLRVDPSRQADAHTQHAVPGNALLGGDVLHHAAYQLEGIGIGLQHELYVLYERLQVALEVRDGHVEVLTGHVHSHEIAGLRVESVYAGTAASGGSLLAHILQEAFRNEFLHQFGGRWYGNAYLVGDVGYGITFIQKIETQDLPFQG